MTEEEINETPEEPTNQTLFSNQEPILQQGKSSFVKKEMGDVVQKKKPANQLVIIAGAAGITLLILIVLLAILKPRTTTIQVTASPTSSPTAQASKSQFQQRLDELSSDLNDADPSKLDLSVPPVDMTLTLDPIKKN